jgi:hypothetical protein
LRIKRTLLLNKENRIRKDWKERKLTSMIDFQRLKFTCCYAFQFEQFKIRIKWRSRISILRSNEERENDIGAVENNIIRWRNEIAQLEKEWVYCT